MTEVRKACLEWASIQMSEQSIVWNLSLKHRVASSHMFRISFIFSAVVKIIVSKDWSGKRMVSFCYINTWNCGNIYLYEKRSGAYLFSAPLLVYMKSGHAIECNIRKWYDLLRYITRVT